MIHLEFVSNVDQKIKVTVGSPRVQTTMTDISQNLLGLDGRGLFRHIEPWQERLKCYCTSKCDSVLLKAMIKRFKTTINPKVAKQNIIA